MRIICSEVDNKKQEAMSWLLVFLSIAGVVLNVRRDRCGFLLWMIANIGWMIIDFMQGLYAQAFLFCIYFVLSFWGWVSWKK